MSDSSKSTSDVADESEFDAQHEDSVEMGDDKIELTNERGYRWKLLSTYFSLLYATSFVVFVGLHVFGVIDMGMLPRRIMDLYIALTASTAAFVIGSEVVSAYVNHQHSE